MCMFYHHPLSPTVLVCMLVRTMHVVREDVELLVVTVMCSSPSDEPFTLIVQTSDGSAVGEQMNQGCYSACWFVCVCFIQCESS